MKNTGKITALVLCVSLIVSVFSFISSAEETADGFPLTLSDEVKDMVKEAVFEADIGQLRELLKTGLITSRELTEYYLERIEVYDGDYNCFITLCDDALEKADERDRQIKEGADGLLLGIPVVLKDNIDYEGCLTTNGHSKTGSYSYVADKNADVTELLLKEGAVILGKTNMATDAQTAYSSISIAAGETLGAYGTHLSPGGSSGGTAVAVSLNFAAAGLGTDTNSSLRIPAAFNGDVALRSTFGLVPMSGIIGLNKKRDVAGAITRTVRDSAVMLDILTGGEYSYTENLDGNSLSGTRIGVLEDLCDYGPYIKKSDVDPEITELFEKRIQELSDCGAEIVRVSMNGIFEYRNSCSEDRSGSESQKEKFLGEFRELLSENDICAVIFPSCLSTPLSSGRDSNGVPVASTQSFQNNAYYFSPAIGVPEITVPIGNHSNGGGLGMEIVGDKNSEQLLLNLAYSYEKSYPHRAVPSLAGSLYEMSERHTPAELLEIATGKPQKTKTKEATVKAVKSGKVYPVFCAIFGLIFSGAVYYASILTEERGYFDRRFSMRRKRKYYD